MGCWPSDRFVQLFPEASSLDYGRTSKNSSKFFLHPRGHCSGGRRLP